MDAVADTLCMCDLTLLLIAFHTAMSSIESFPLVAIKAKQRCVMGVGMCLYAQLVQTKNKQCKSAIILQCYHPHFCCAMLCIARLLPSPGVRLSVRPSRS